VSYAAVSTNIYLKISVQQIPYSCLHQISTGGDGGDGDGQSQCEGDGDGSGGKGIGDGDGDGDGDGNSDGDALIRILHNETNGVEYGDCSLAEKANCPCKDPTCPCPTADREFVTCIPPAEGTSSWWIYLVATLCPCVLLLIAGYYGYHRFNERMDWVVPEEMACLDELPQQDPHTLVSPRMSEAWETRSQRTTSSGTVIKGQLGFEGRNYKKGASSATEDFLDFGYGNIDYNRQLRKSHKIGEGQYGEVWACVLRRQTPWPARHAAMKELYETGNTLWIVKEAQLLQEVGWHPNVVKLLGVSMEPPCLVMELVPHAQELDVYLQEYRRSHTKKHYIKMACLTLLDIACGMDYIHTHKILHRDLTPRNVLVNSRTGVAQVNDFGLSCGITDPDQKRIGSVRSNSSSCGKREAVRDENAFVIIDPDSACYRAAPENFGSRQFGGKQVHLFQSDSFMFGMMMWEALSERWVSLHHGSTRRGFYKDFEEGFGLVDDAPLDVITMAAKFGEQQRRGMQVLALHLKVMGISEVPSLIDLNMQCLRQDHRSRLLMEEIATHLRNLIHEIDWSPEEGCGSLDEDLSSHGETIESNAALSGTTVLLSTSACTALVPPNSDDNNAAENPVIHTSIVSV